MDQMTRPHRTMAELKEAMPHILDAPKEEGRVDMIISRPDHGERTLPQRVRVTAEFGVEGDHWSRGCWMTADDGTPHPEVQICMMMSRVIEAIAGAPENWPPAGDNLFLEMDLTPASMPPGTRFSIGSAEFIVTPVPHNGCESFIERYGRDACVFVNTGEGRAHRLRGIYARVTRDGEIAVGDTVRRL